MPLNTSTYEHLKCRSEYHSHLKGSNGRRVSIVEDGESMSRWSTEIG